MEKQLTILGISGSLRNNSAHTAILQHLKATFAQHNFVIYDELEAIPNFNPEKDTDNVPEAVASFRNAIGQADAVLFCTPEYAYGIPGALKNALDWTVSSGDFVDKPVAVITASGLGEHAHASMLLVLTALNSKMVENGSILISWIRSKMNAENQITDAQTEQDIRAVLERLVAVV